MFNETAYHDHRFLSLSIDNLALRNHRFFDCKFERCLFPEADLRGCQFVDCTFEACDLSLTQVIDSIFNTVSFRECKLMGINWTVAQWSMMSAINFTDCNLSHGTFFGVDMRRSSIVNCVARNIDLTETNLTGVNCQGTDFSEARFHQTNLTKANFVGATNYTIDAGHNTLKATRFAMPQAIRLLHSLDIELVDD